MDLINGAYELLGGLFIFLNCRRIYKDRQVKGVSWLTIVFFTTWGYWNLVFYPSYGAWLSAIGSVGVCAANTTWLGMALYFTRKGKKHYPVSVIVDGEERPIKHHYEPGRCVFDEKVVLHQGDILKWSNHGSETG